MTCMRFARAAFLLVLLTLAAASPAHAVFSGSNGRITFAADDANFNGDVWTINSDGTGATRVSFGYKADNPSFSPDGTKIVFDAYDNTQIWVMNADGSGKVKLTSGVWPLRDANPHFLPSGQIIFERRDWDQGGTHLIRINADGSNPVALTPHTPESSDRDASVNSSGAVAYAATGTAGTRTSSWWAARTSRTPLTSTASTSPI